MKGYVIRKAVLPVAVYQNITQIIGSTPLVHLQRLGEYYACHGEIYGKCEFLNPTGSLKDRSALGILQNAVRSGALAPGGTVICLSGGRGGISAAMLCACMDLRCIVVATDNITLQSMRHIRAFGAEIRMTPAGEGLEGMKKKGEALQRQLPGSFILNQFEDDAGAELHRTSTGPELIADLPDIDYLVAGVGTGASLTGCAEYVQRMRPECVVVAVEPMDSPVLSGGLPGAHSLTGIGLGFTPRVLNKYILNQVARVRTPDALTMTRQLAVLEGMLCGPSSGAALTAAVSIAQNPAAQGKKIAVLLPDRGEDYLSREIYNK